MTIGFETDDVDENKAAVDAFLENPDMVQDVKGALEEVFGAGVEVTLDGIADEENATPEEE